MPIDSHADGPDSGTLPQDCGHVGPYLKCGDECDPCGEDGSYCSPYYDICLPNPVGYVGDGCNLVRDPIASPVGEALVYCENEFVCALHPTVSSDSWLRGVCLDPNYCREAAEQDIGVECTYSDYTDFITGPPTGDPCPAEEAHPLSPLCGTGCGTDVCSWPAPGPIDPFRQTSCIGISDTRGVGVCVFFAESPCNRMFPDVIEEFIAGCVRDAGAPCACLAKRNEDGTLWDRAWPTFEQSCRLYASLYPDDFACVGATWEPL